MHNVFQKANVPLPSDKFCNFPRAVGVNRTEMHGSNINNISRLLNFEIAEKLNSSCMTQVPERIIHCNSGHFVEPEFEPYHVPHTLLPISDYLVGKLF